MSTEHKSPKPVNNTTPSTSFVPKSTGLSRPAVHPYQKMAVEENNREENTQGTVIPRTPEQAEHLPPEAWHVVQQRKGRIQSTIQLKENTDGNEELERETEQDGTEANAMEKTASPKLSNTTTNVVQRTLLTKSDIFGDQVKWIIVKGIARHIDGGSGDEKAKALTDLFDKKGIIDIETILHNIGKKKFVQKNFFANEKDRALSDITLTRLQKEDMVMEAVSAADVTKAKWDLYKTEIDDKTATGYSGKLSGPGGDEVKTTIEWEDDHKGQGKGVTANVLAADHPLGSTPDDTIKDKVRNLEAIAQEKEYIAGHLLNNNLGGPGNDARNLTAIPKDVNSEMSKQVEDEVIKRVNKNYEVIYYKVAVEYGTDSALDYASRITIEFGTYKHDTDFTTPTTNDLEEKHTFTIPINSPTEYGNRKKGYNKASHSDKTTYTDESGKNPFDWPAAEKTAKDPARIDFDRTNNIVLKNTTQIKLEFISAAIYSLRFEELKREIADLELEKDLSDVNARELKVKYDKLSAEAAKVKFLEEEVKRITIEFEKTKEDFQSEHISFEETNKENAYLKEEISFFEEEIKQLQSQLLQQDHIAALLKEQLDEYINKTRERADSYGYIFGLDDGRKGYENRLPEHKKSRRISIGSESEFSKGYLRGYEEGKAQLQKEIEIARLKEENDTLKKESEEKDKKVGSLIEENAILKEKNEKKDERIKELEALLALQEKKTVVPDIKDVKVTTRNTDDTNEQEKKIDFGELLKTAFNDKGMDGYVQLGRLTNMEIPKYDYLAMLVYCEHINSEEACAAYPNTRYYRKFKSSSYGMDAYNEFRKLYLED